MRLITACLIIIVCHKILMKYACPSCRLEPNAFSSEGGDKKDETKKDCAKAINFVALSRLISYIFFENCIKCIFAEHLMTFLVPFTKKNKLCALGRIILLKKQARKKKKNRKMKRRVKMALVSVFNVHGE